jgi:hypothetical protein
MKKLLIILLVFVSNTGLARDFMDLKIVKYESSFLLYLVNTSDERIFLIMIFSLGSKFDFSELTFELTDTNGNKYPFSVKNKLGMATSEQFINIEPNEVIGKVFSITQLVQYYDLGMGDYKLKVFYQNKNTNIDSSFNEELESKTIEISIN